jgi:hypothetical protein
MPCRPSCSCRQFRRQHAEFTDGFLSVEMSCAMQEHLYQCPTCATRDVWVRRSLLALQVLPSIEPSAHFHERLYERLGEPLTLPTARLQLANSRGR